MNNNSDNIYAEFFLSFVPQHQTISALNSINDIMIIIFIVYPLVIFF